MIIKDKTGQGFGGLIRVFVVGLVFFATFPLLQVVMESIIGENTGVIADLMTVIIFLPVYFFAAYAINLGAE